ncbi:MAG: DUF3793 family protein [bacterium]|nr:DUF3793 family protein [bacterium]
MKLILEDVWSDICSRHREDTLSYLMVKTAAVRCGVKPGELLRVPGCYKGLNGLCPTFHQRLKDLALPYRVLTSDATGVLVLFYHPTALTTTLSHIETKTFLQSLGYSMESSPLELLETLVHRWQQAPAHEVGIFIGYPLADVEGFMRGHRKRSISTLGDRWQVFSDLAQARRLMRRHRRLELRAAGICAKTTNTTERLKRIAAFSTKQYS